MVSPSVDLYVAMPLTTAHGLPQEWILFPLLICELLANRPLGSAGLGTRQRNKTTGPYPIFAQTLGDPPATFQDLSWPFQSPRSFPPGPYSLFPPFSPGVLPVAFQ